MRRPVKDSTIIAEVIRQALDLMTYKLNDRPLRKGEILGVATIEAKIILRGNTNLTAYGWAIYSGRRGDWQCDLNHNRYVRGTPKPCVLSCHSQAMLGSIPSDHGLYRLQSSGLGYRAEPILEPETSAEPVLG